MRMNRSRRGWRARSPQPAHPSGADRLARSMAGAVLLISLILSPSTGRAGIGEGVGSPFSLYLERGYVLPNAVAADLSAPFPLSLETIGADFRDDFDGTSLGAAWVVNQNGGQITVGGGVVSISGSGSTFPYVRNGIALIPAGDFTLEFRMKYDAVAGRGTGIRWSVGAPANGGSGLCTGIGPSAFGVWQDTGVGHLNLVYAHSDPCTETSVALGGGTDLGWHVYAFSRSGGTYSLSVDGTQAWTGTDPYANNFPFDLWFGNPMNAGFAGAWSSISLDYVAVTRQGGLSPGCSFSDFSSIAGLTLYGSAQQVGSVLRVVPSAYGVIGGAFWSQPVDVTNFQTDFRFRFSSLVQGGADGIVFCVRGPGSRLPGGGGGGMGYYLVSPSVGVEIDIYYNTQPHVLDPNGNHIGIDVNGSIISSPVAVDPVGPGVSLENGNVYHMWVDYANGTLSVSIAQDGQPKPPAILTRALTLPFSTGVVGFTASTGADYANHDILSWSFSNVTSEIPSITQIVPSQVNWKDTGVDLLIEGSGFQPGAEILLSAPVSAKSSTRWWNAGQLHVTVDIEGAAPGPISVTVRNANGHVSNPATLSVDPLTPIGHPRSYAPVFWFAPDEKWFPTSPFFDAAGKTYYDSAQARHQEYLSLGRDEAKRQATVYYYVHPTPVPFPRPSDGLCFVYEYWLYFTFDEFLACNAIAFNRHYHDWEKFFVFVDKDDWTVRGMAGSAHLPINASNVFEMTSPEPSPYHPLALVELGGHATCPDRDGNGSFDVTVDVNGCARNAAWGIKDGVASRVGSDKLYHPDAGGGLSTYRLADLEGLRALVDPRFTQTRSFWEGSQEERCATCGLRLGRLFQPFIPDADTTFSFSRAVRPHDGSTVIPFVATFCTRWCWDAGTSVRLAHVPIEHAWRGEQGEYLKDPRKILPGCYESLSPRRVYGIVRNLQVATRHCDVAILLGHGGGGSSKPLTIESSTSNSVFAYAKIDSTGAIAFPNAQDGLHTVYIDTDVTAPYEQTVMVSPADTLLGVNGNIALVSRDRYFTLKCVVTDADHDPIPVVSVAFMVEPDSLFLPTWTDSLGVACASADTADTYRVEVSVLSYHDTRMGLRGSYGDTVEVAFMTPFDVWDATDSPDTRTRTTRLRQGYPNPFNPATVVEFELATRQFVKLEIWRIDGRRVRTLVSETLAPAHYRRIWDGLDDRGTRVASGVYTCTLRVGELVQSKKLVIVR